MNSLTTDSDLRGRLGWICDWLYEAPGRAWRFLTSKPPACKHPREAWKNIVAGRDLAIVCQACGNEIDRMPAAAQG